MIDYNELVYEENFVKTTTNPEYVYYSVCETYTMDLGWVVEKPTIEKIDDQYYRITIPLKRYKVKSKSM